MPGRTLDYLSVSPRTKHTATVIFVHGLGDTGFGWRPLAEVMSKDPELNRVKWVLPHAPRRYVTINSVYMPSWYNITSMNPITEDETDILQSAKAIDDLITAEIESGTPADRIILGGLSQGAAMTLLTGFTTKHRLGGLIVLSGRLPLRNKFKSLPISDHIKELPIFWGHGTEDPIVEYKLGLLSMDYIKSELGIRTASDSNSGVPTGLSFHSYKDLGHTNDDRYDGR
ncbi:unnamed protein product [Somion occarium]|uniref:Acyl-protein thioesterase 1 n=1 Tax=Somion occarium TaxID=3059160 RepID=A0ABP1CVC0_9APHY